jgi:hypothetical protein
LDPTVHYRFISKTETVVSTKTIGSMSAHAVVYFSSSYVTTTTVDLSTSVIDNVTTVVVPTLSLVGFQSYSCLSMVTSRYHSSNTLVNLCHSFVPVSSCTTSITNNFDESFCLYYVPATTTYLGVSVSVFFTPITLIARESL